ncbi:hypothetical protein BaRGS_00017183, partial [Batillaria attramentaria]
MSLVQGFREQKTNRAGIKGKEYRLRCHGSFRPTGATKQAEKRSGSSCQYEL